MDANAISNSTEAKKRRRRGSLGRQRIEIKKVEDQSKRQATFSKRRKGLFNKAKEISTLCGAEIGILTVSNSGRMYATDNVDTVLDRFLGEPSGHGNNSLLKLKQVKEEEDINAGFLMDQRIDNLGVVELVEYAMALENLKEKVAARLEELRIQSSSCLCQFVARHQDVDKAEFVQQFTAEGNYDFPQ